MFRVLHLRLITCVITIDLSVTVELSRARELTRQHQCKQERVRNPDVAERQVRRRPNLGEVLGERGDRAAQWSAVSAPLLV